jgi:hypothetical protein
MFQTVGKALSTRDAESTSERDSHSMLNEINDRCDDLPKYLSEPIGRRLLLVSGGQPADEQARLAKVVSGS